MAKKKSNGPSKASLIHAKLVENPKGKPKQIAEELQSEGHDIEPTYVSTIKTQWKKKRGGRKPARGGRRKASTDRISAEALIKAKKLANDFGGVENLKKAVDVLSRLS